jgi:hypothetical protein
MNTIAFDIADSALDDDSEYKAFRTSINGRNLTETLHETLHESAGICLPDQTSKNHIKTGFTPTWAF